MFTSCFRNTKLAATTRQLTRLSTATLCLTALLLTSRVTSLQIRRFSPQLHQTTCGKIRKIMATSTTVTFEGMAETTPDTPSKLLLHEKDGSFFKRDEIGKNPFPIINGLKIISWNVAGLRGTLKKSPEVLNELVDKEKPDILCLQETKLQNIGDFTDLLADRGYKSYWTFSEIKKGYAGTAMFVKEIIDSSKSPKDKENVEHVLNEDIKPKKKAKKQSKVSSFFGNDNEIIIEAGNKISAEIDINNVVKEIPKGTVIVENVTFLLPDKRFNGEGRWIQLETPDFYFINTYVPNSGQNLERLDYRVDEWEPFVRDYLNELRVRKPVIFSGDLNVAHADLDVYNFHAKHLLKQAGTTLREKNAFSTFLSTGFYDSLRYFYPSASGQFTYWSMRTRARPFNKGLRLDYFVCSQEMFDRSIDNVKIEVEKIDNEIKAELVVEMGEGKIEEEEAVVVAKGKSGRKRKMETTTTTPAAAPLVAEENIIVSDNLILQRTYENPRNVKVTDSYILHDINDCSDHCPIALILQMQPPMEQQL